MACSRLEAVTLFGFCVLYASPQTAFACFNEFIEGSKIAFEKAVIHYERKVTEDPNNLQVNFCLGLAYYESGRAKEALPYLEHAVKRDAGSAWYHSALGKALLDTGENLRGISELEEALKIAPDDAKTRRLLTSAKEKMGWGPERELLAKIAFDAQALKPHCAKLRQVESSLPMQESDADLRSSLINGAFDFYAKEILDESPVVLSQTHWEFDPESRLLNILGLGFKDAQKIVRLREILEDRYGLDPCFSILAYENILLLIRRDGRLDNDCFAYFYLKAVETITGKKSETRPPIPPGEALKRPITPLSPYISSDGLLFYAKSMTQLDDRALVYLDKYPDIRWLSLWSPRLTPAGFAALKNLADLEALRLGPMKVGDEGISHIAAMVHLEQLISGGVELTDNGLRHLAGLTKLRQLDVRDNRIDGKGLVHLSGLVNLENLGLGFTGVSDDAIKYVAGFKKLKQLFLNNTPIGDSALAKLEGLSDLRVLNLHGTKVSDAGIGSLQKLKSLREVYLGKTAVSDSGKESLRKSRAGLYVLD